jgi:hypothetical protein
MDYPERKRFLAFLILSCFAVVSASCGGGSSSDANTPFIGDGTGEAVLSWSPPTTNTDGSSVDLMGFRIYAGETPTNLQPALFVDAIDTTAVISGLATGTYYFAVTAVGISGAESVFSNIENKTIP